MINPCKKDCERRKANCHATCPDGIAYEEYNRDRNEFIRKQKEKDNIYGGYKLKEHNKAEKIRRNKPNKWK